MEWELHQRRDFGVDEKMFGNPLKLPSYVASAVKGGMPRDVTVSGDVTLASGRFDVQDWSWSQSFAERVRALGLRLDDAESAIEEAVEAAT